jgi:hypothetical protein
LTGEIREQLDNEEGAGHGRRPSPPRATESDPWRPSRRMGASVPSEGEARA